MKKYEDFMRINMSKEENVNIYDGVGYNYDECKDLRIYSKIIVQFNNFADVDRYEEDEPYVNSFVTSSSIEGSQCILFTDCEDAFNDLVSIFEKYDCDIYQYIIEEVKEDINFNSYSAAGRMYYFEK